MSRRTTPVAGRLLPPLALLLALGAPVAAAAQVAPPAPPRTTPHADTAHGVVIPDEYRWMETAGAALDPWIDAEDAHARAALRRVARRAALEAELLALARDGFGTQVEVPIARAGGRTVATDWRLDRPRLVVRDGDGAPHVLHDPDAPGPDSGARVLSAATVLSPDGRTLAVGLAARGDAAPRIRFVDLEARRWLDDVLALPLWADARGFHVAWLPDSRHLLWVRNPRRTAATPDGEREFHGHVYRHRLGTPPARDAALFGRTLQPAIAADDTPYPGVSADGRWLVVYVRGTDRRELWVAPNAPGDAPPSFRRVLASAGTVFGWGVRDGALYAVVGDDAPRHRLVRVALDDPSATPATVLEGRDGVLAGVAVARDAIYVARRDGAAMSLWRLAADGALQPVALPRVGTFEELHVGQGGAGARLRLRSPVYPSEWVAVAPGASVAVPEEAPVRGLPAMLDSVTVTVEQAPARDGVLVPVTLVHRRDRTRDGTAPLRILAYGCHGSARNPAYDPTDLAWLARGGVLAVAHVRGGSELGREWHLAAVRRGRATAPEDVVDVAKHLVRAGWTGAGRVSVAGDSCGGTTMGIAALDRPDLIGAAVLTVGGVDEWRAWSEGPSGARSVFDVGDPRTAEGVRRIVAGSAYHQILPGARRPAFLLVNGGTDYTVPLWMGAKFVARARAAAPASDRPVLFRVWREMGHDGPTDVAGVAGFRADEFAFLLWQAGHPDYQPERP